MKYPTILRIFLCFVCFMLLSNIGEKSNSANGFFGSIFAPVKKTTHEIECDKKIEEKSRTFMSSNLRLTLLYRYWERIASTLQKSVNELEAEKKKIKQDLQKEVKNHEITKNSLQTCEKVVLERTRKADENYKLSEYYKSKNGDLKTKYGELENQNRQITLKSAKCDKDLKDCMDAKNAKQAKIEEMDTEIENLNSASRKDKEKCKADLDLKESEKNKLLGLKNALSDQIDANNKKCNNEKIQLRNGITNLQSVYDACEISKTKLQKEKDEISQKLTETETKLETEKENYIKSQQSLEQEKTQSSQNIATLNTQINQLKNTNSQLTNSLQAERSENSKLTQENQSLKEQIEDLKKRLGENLAEKLKECQQNCDTKTNTLEAALKNSQDQCKTDIVNLTNLKNADIAKLQKEHNIKVNELNEKQLAAKQKSDEEIQRLKKENEDNQSACRIAKDNLKNDCEVEKNRLQQSKDELEKSLKAEIASFKKKAEVCEGEHATLKESSKNQIEKLNKDIDDLKALMESEKKSLKMDCDIAKAQLTAEKEKIDKEWSKKHSDFKTEKEAEIAKLNSNILELEKQLKELKENFVKKEKELNAKLTNCISEKNTCLNAKANLEKEISEKKKQIEELTKLANLYKKLQQDLTEVVAKKQSLLEKAKSYHKYVLAEFNKLLKKIAKPNCDFAKNSEISKCTKQKEDIENKYKELMKAEEEKLQSCKEQAAKPKYCYKQNCYEISTEKMSYDDSLAYCKKKSMVLAMTSDENARLYLKIIGSSFNIRSFHISGTDNSFEGYWVNSYGLVNSQSYWKYGQPNSDGDCRMMYDGYMYDDSCKKELNAMCMTDPCSAKKCSTEYKPICGSDLKTYPNKCELEKAQCYVGKDKLQIKNNEACSTENQYCTTTKCFHHIYANYKWHFIGAFCKSKGYKMAFPQNAVENTILAKLAATFRYSIFINVNDEKKVNHWVGPDNKEVVYTNWNGGEPNGGTNENCAEVHGNGGWNDITCHLYRRVACEEDLTKEPVKIDMKISMSNDYEFCKKQNKYLPILKSRFDHIKLRNIACDFEKNCGYKKVLFAGRALNVNDYFTSDYGQRLTYGVSTARSAKANQCYYMKARSKVVGDCLPAEASEKYLIYCLIKDQTIESTHDLLVHARMKELKKLELTRAFILYSQIGTFCKLQSKIIYSFDSPIKLEAASKLTGASAWVYHGGIVTADKKSLKTPENKIVFDWFDRSKMSSNDVSHKPGTIVFAYYGPSSAWWDYFYYTSYRVTRANIICQIDVDYKPPDYIAPIKTTSNTVCDQKRMISAVVTSQTMLDHLQFLHCYLSKRCYIEQIQLNGLSYVNGRWYSSTGIYLDKIAPSPAGSPPNYCLFAHGRNIKVQRCTSIWRYVLCTSKTTSVTKIYEKIFQQQKQMFLDLKTKLSSPLGLEDAKKFCSSNQMRVANPESTIDMLILHGLLGESKTEKDIFWTSGTITNKNADDGVFPVPIWEYGSKTIKDGSKLIFINEAKSKFPHIWFPVINYQSLKLRIACRNPTEIEKMIGEIIEKNKSIVLYSFKENIKKDVFEILRDPKQGDKSLLFADEDKGTHSLFKHVFANKIPKYMDSVQIQLLNHLNKLLFFIEFKVPKGENEAWFRPQNMNKFYPDSLQNPIKSNLFHIFKISGYVDSYVQRRFYISLGHRGCNYDVGILMVGVKVHCYFERKYLRLPVILYTTSNPRWYTGVKHAHRLRIIGRVRGSKPNEPTITDAVMSKKPVLLFSVKAGSGVKVYETFMNKAIPPPTDPTSKNIRYAVHDFGRENIYKSMYLHSPQNYFKQILLEVMYWGYPNFVHFRITFNVGSDGSWFSRYKVAKYEPDRSSWIKSTFSHFSISGEVKTRWVRRFYINNRSHYYCSYEYGILAIRETRLYCYYARKYHSTFPKILYTHLSSNSNWNRYVKYGSRFRLVGIPK